MDSVDEAEAPQNLDHFSEDMKVIDTTSQLADEDKIEDSFARIMEGNESSNQEDDEVQDVNRIVKNVDISQTTDLDEELSMANNNRKAEDVPSEANYFNTGRSGNTVGSRRHGLKSDAPKKRKRSLVLRRFKKGRRPPPSHPIFQQRLPAWQPMYTAWTVIPFIFVIGLVFIPIGLGLLSFSNKVTEIKIPYTDCISTRHTGDQKCSEILKKNRFAYCTCEIPFTLDQQLRHKVYMYYSLTNFYQNLRRYVKSRDEKQLSGITEGEPDENCEPFAYKDGKKIYPCGAIANSMFSDEISLHYRSSNGAIKEVGLIRTGIAWEFDKKRKFKNPKDISPTSPMWQTCTKPKAWKKELWQLDPENPDNNGIQNEDFIVWMRNANLPHFRKLYRIVNTSAEGFVGGLPKGHYFLKINYSFPVVDFGGTKSIVLSNASLFGGKDNFLGISFVVVGSVCMFIGIGLLVMHVKSGKSLWEKIDINPQTPWVE